VIERSLHPWGEPDVAIWQAVHVRGRLSGYDRKESPSGGKRKLAMSYMTFSVGTMDASHIPTMAPLVTSKLEALGSSRARGALVLTGELTGAAIASSTWDSVDTAFAARAALYADSEAVAAFGAANWVPLGFFVSELQHERGNGEGPFTVGVNGVSENHDPKLGEELTDLVWGVVADHGINGMRSLRAIAAGEQTGTYMNIFYTDSLDSYMAASASLAANSDFVGMMMNNGGRIVSRQINRTM
jgi:hypothetical protein